MEREIINIGVDGDETGMIQISKWEDGRVTVLMKDSANDTAALIFSKNSANIAKMVEALGASNDS